MKISIDVVSDVICPWCFLGKRRLDKALAMLDGLDIEVAWRPFMLDPSIPPEGIDRRAYMVGKFGAERVKTIHDPLIAAGKAEGVPYDFEAITRTPNSLDAHRVIRWSHLAGLQSRMAERLFMAFWSEGRNISDHQVLGDCAADLGIDRPSLIRQLATDHDKDAVLGEINMAAKMGIRGVPTFVIGRRYGVSGAQAAEVLADTIRKVAAEQMAAPGAE
jgi:predicted DsbA family dithiol-disulfide isomerase